MGLGSSRRSDDRLAHSLRQLNVMTWLTFLVIAVMIALVAALFGLQPKGGRKVAGTQLMAVGRIVLVIGILIVGWLILR